MSKIMLLICLCAISLLPRSLAYAHCDCEQHDETDTEASLAYIGVLGVSLALVGMADSVDGYDAQAYIQTSGLWQGKGEVERKTGEWFGSQERWGAGLSAGGISNRDNAEKWVGRWEIGAWQQTWEAGEDSGSAPRQLDTLTLAMGLHAQWYPLESSPLWVSIGGRAGLAIVNVQGTKDDYGQLMLDAVGGVGWDIDEHVSLYAETTLSRMVAPHSDWAGYEDAWSWTLGAGLRYRF